MTKFYAHTLPDKDETNWQPLKDHLISTSKLAASFAAEFNAEDWGKAVGLLHDIGKYSTDFQKRLRGAAFSVDHSTAGAQKSLELYKIFPGKLVAYVVAGHHGGLPDAGSTMGNKSDLNVRLKNQSIPIYDKYKEEMEDFIPRSLTGSFKPVEGQELFSIHHFVRMIYSCLVDADYLDTENFMDPNKASLRKNDSNIYHLLNLFKNHISNIQVEAKKSPINSIRKQILNDCIKKAEDKPGFFTLSVPTGGGKTLSSMAFALNHAVIYDKRRVIYTIPYTSIIEQNAAVYRDIFGDENVLEHHSNIVGENIVNTKNEEKEEISSAKWKLATENWDKDIVVTTNVQFFESLFANKSSRCRKLHRIANSVIVIDEAQVTPDEYFNPCTKMLAELVRNYGCTVVLCTATQPVLDQFLSPDIKVKEIVSNKEILYKQLNRAKVEHLGKLSMETMEKRLLAQNQVLCIVNTRNHARTLYENIGNGEGHYHLSTRMCPDHRTEMLNQIKERLREGLTCRVISTQLIEAGVDIDFPVVFRSEAGLDSIIQAAGRCNREGKLPYGNVFVFSPEEVKPPRGWMARAASVAGVVIQNREEEGKEIITPEAIQHYFKERYFIEGKEKFDHYRILEKINELGSSGDFPFKTISESFRFIDDSQETVVIPYNEKAKELIQLVIQGVKTKDLYRKLQRYSVSVYPFELLDLQKNGSIQHLEGDMKVLTEESLYDSQLGILTTSTFSTVRVDNFIME